ncbi:Thiol:disulfide interchange protein DsbD [Paraburkholderia nemoris]|uniref:cytochrome c biogenesis CcdA family protein n=1 Tax=Paraburkholderia nemoris TaxID=2793076 RepID=UPI001B09092F|nr:MULTISPECIES: cytochrome c biogenesis CcdA family protein [Paraburkholderia]CAE6852206.1 Thiol:disulfide interchange protein DsbD [Paraburkholderia nemoris]
MMDFGASTYFFGFAAGMLSVLSPCVLPLIPILLSTAANNHRLGPLSLALGLTISFAAIGTTMAAAGARTGLDQNTFRSFGAVLIGVFGAIQLSKLLQARFALAVSGISRLGENVLSRMKIEGALGQLVLGVVLGLVWSPCVGPTLGGAIALASQGKNLTQTVFLMSLFGLGAGTPLIMLGLLSREHLQKKRNSLLVAGNYGKVLVGLGMLVVSALILTKTDKIFETFVTARLPDWLIDLSSKY